MNLFSYLWPSKDATNDVDTDLRTYFDEVTNATPASEKAAEKNAAEERPKTTGGSSIKPFVRAGEKAPKTLNQIARENCIEYAKAYTDCIVKGTMWDRLIGCPDQDKMYVACQELQTSALEVLGFNRTDSVDERAQIKADADDLMIKYVPKLVITNDMATNFKNALAERQK